MARSNSEKRTHARAQEWFYRPSNPVLLCLIVISGHVYGLIAYGATFWVDIRAYVYFSQIFESLQSARTVFQNIKYSLLYTHVGWGESFIWFLLAKLPMNLSWPVMAIGKHLLGIVALSYLLLTINKLYPCRVHLISALVISYLPFYQAMHNELMTEAVSTNCVLLTLAASLRIYVAGSHTDRHGGTTEFTGLDRFSWMLLLVASCIIVQFRAVLIVYPASFLFVIALKRFSVRYVLISSGALCLILASSFSFTYYRYLLTGIFAVPSDWNWSIITGQNIARTTSPEVMNYAKTVPWPDEKVYLDKVEKGTIGRLDLEELFVYWWGIGMTTGDIRRICDNFKRLHFREGGYWLPGRRLLVGFTTLGLTAYAPLLPNVLIPQRGQDGISFYRDRVKQYRYHSWINPNPDEFAGYSTIYFDQTPAHNYYLATIKPYLKLRKSIFNNPIWLATVPLDIWPLGACCSLIYLLKRREMIMAFLLLPMILYCSAIYFNPVSAGIRYSHSFIPLYICYIAIAIAVYVRGSVEIAAESIVDRSSGWQG